MLNWLATVLLLKDKVDSNVSKGKSNVDKKKKCQNVVSCKKFKHLQNIFQQWRPFYTNKGKLIENGNNLC